MLHISYIKIIYAYMYNTAFIIFQLLNQLIDKLYEHHLIIINVIIKLIKATELNVITLILMTLISNFSVVVHMVYNKMYSRNKL